VGGAAVTQFHEDDAEAVFAPIRAFFQQHGIEARFAYAVGHAAEVIATHAEDGRFDLLIMGSRGHGEVVNLVLGSVVTKVLARTSTPLLLIR
jgi:nucleotide-binding universal stress UspA family protein